MELLLVDAPERVLTAFLIASLTASLYLSLSYNSFTSEKDDYCYIYLEKGETIYFPK